MSQARIDGRGRDCPLGDEGMAFHTQLRAVIQCDYEDPDDGSGCTYTAEYKVGAEEVSLDTFCADAKEHFESLGWETFGTTLCPCCARKVDTDNFITLLEAGGN